MGPKLDEGDDVLERDPTTDEHLELVTEARADERRKERVDLEKAREVARVLREGSAPFDEPSAADARHVEVDLARTEDPLRPIGVTRAGNVITVKFSVPSPPIVLDESLVANPGRYGFEYTDDRSSAAITSVRIASPDTIEITLSNTPAHGHPLYNWCVHFDQPVP